MGKQSSLGPIDPQIGGLPAGAILEEFDRAALEIKSHPEKIPLWQVIIGQYNPTLLLQCENSLAWSKEIVSKWLREGMFFEEEESSEKINKMVEKLSDHKATKSHGRQISSEEAKEIGFKIIDLEEDNELQDLVLTVHHTFMHTFENSPSLKIVENHRGIAMIFKGSEADPKSQITSY